MRKEMGTNYNGSKKFKNNNELFRAKIQYKLTNIIPTKKSTKLIKKYFRGKI